MPGPHPPLSSSADYGSRRKQAQFVFGTLLLAVWMGVVNRRLKVFPFRTSSGQWRQSNNLSGPGRLGDESIMVPSILQMFLGGGKYNVVSKKDRYMACRMNRCGEDWCNGLLGSATAGATR